MMKLSRSECPNWLAENCQRWATQWRNKYENPLRGNDWNWYIFQGTPVNQHLLPLLVDDTNHHCSYCDKRPIGVETIDHFKPKTTFLLDSYSWENLFVACYDCQVSRWNDYGEFLLKPDEIEYEFDKYFYYDDVSGKIEPNGEEDSIEYQKADFTRKAFKLNERGLPEARKQISDNKAVFQEYNIEIVPYRFIFAE